MPEAWGSPSSPAWGTLVGGLEVAPVPSWAKHQGADLLHRLPDWLIAAWADALGVDYMSGYQAFPEA
ncbi:MAG: hypothetical protein DRI39_09150, partial [Chloroflexi bacterium]